MSFGSGSFGSVPFAGSSGGVPASTVNLGQASEADSTFALTLTVGVVKQLGQASEADSALTIASIAVGKVVTLGQATETDSAAAVTIVTGTFVTLGMATETDSALSLSLSAIQLGQATETDSALAASVLVGFTVTLGMATETDSASPISFTAPITVNLGRATETDTARAVTITYSYHVIDTTNRVNGLSLGGTMPLLFEPAVDPAPARAAKRRVIAASAFDNVDTTGTEATYDVVTKTRRRLRERYVIGGKDATYIFGVETELTWQLVSPLLYGPATARFPGIKTPFRQVGSGSLRWLRKGANVRVQLVNDDDEVQDTVYKGLVLAWDIDGTDLTVQIGGEASGRAAMEWKPLPVYDEARAGAGKRAYNLIRGLGLPFNPFQGPDTPSQRVPKLGGYYTIDAIEYLCRNTQRRDGTQYSIMPGNGGAYRFEAKDRTTVHATAYVDGTRVRANVRSDMVDEPNRIYADAVTEDGKRLTGIQSPGIIQGTPPDFGGNMGLGDTGGQVPVLIDRLQGFELLDVDEGRTGFDADVEEAVKDLQDAAGLTETGVVNEATWNALFDLDVTGLSLRMAHREPAAQQQRVAKYRTTPTGAAIRKNPNYEANRPKVDMHVDMGAGVSFRQRKRWAKAELPGPNAVSWSGTLEVTTGAVIEGNHHFGDALTSADLMDTRLLQPGMNIMLRGFQDDEGTLFHISGRDADGSFLIDTRARDTLPVWDAVQRRRDENRWARGRRASTEVKDSVGEWDGAGGGMIRTAVDLVGEEWTIFAVPAGDEGTVSRIRMATNPNAESCVVLFGGPLVPAAIKSYLDRKIPTPLTEGGTDAFTDNDIHQKLKDNGLLGVWGEHLDPAGYHPRSKSAGGDLTGVLSDDAGIAYRTARFPVLYVAVWADRDTTIPAGRIMWNQLEPGA